MTPGKNGGVPRRIERLKALYLRGVVWGAVGLTSSLVVIMGAEVFYRYVLNDSLIWAEEVARDIFIWMTFLFAGAAFQRGEMISIELLVGRFSRWGRVVLVAPAYLCILALLAVIVWYGYVFADLNSSQTIPAVDFIWSGITGRENADVGLSMFWNYLSVPIGSAILFIHILFSLVGMIAAAIRGEDLRRVAPTEQIPADGWGD